jgi:hypothetical protein
MRCKFQVKQYLIDHGSAEALTTGRAVLSGTNSSTEEVSTQ